MKLHLPKQLFTALLAAITLAAPAALTLGSVAWSTEEVSTSTEWGSDTQKVYETGEYLNIKNSGTTLTLNGATITGGAVMSLHTGGSNVIIKDGSNVVISRLVTHDDHGGSSSENVTLDTGGTLTITDSDTGSGNFWTAVLLGHWGNATSTALNVSGGQLNVLNGTVQLGYSSAGQLNISAGEANIKKINVHSGALTLTGGRLNIGSGGITGNAAQRVTFTSGTLGALDSNGWTLSHSGTTTIGSVIVDTNVYSPGAKVGAGTSGAGVNISLLGDLTAQNGDDSSITLLGSGSLTIDHTWDGALNLANGATAKVLINTGDMSGFDAVLSRKYGDTQASGFATYQIFNSGSTASVYSTTDKDNALTLTAGAYSTSDFHVRDTVNYADIDGTVSKFYVQSTGTFTCETLPGIQISNNGNVAINAGAGDVNLNNIFNAETGITQTAGAKTMLMTSGHVSTTSALSIAGTLEIKGTDSSNKATITNTQGWESGTLILENAVATLTKNEGRGLKSNIILNNGANLTINGGNDFVNYSGTYAWEVNSGATLIFGTDTSAARQTLGRNFVLTLNGGTVVGKSDGADGTLDFYSSGGTIKVTADSYLNTAVRARGNTVTFNIAQNATLTMGSHADGAANHAAFYKHGDNHLIDKTGAGTLLYQGSAFDTPLKVSNGVFEYYLEDERTHSGSISGSGTFRKSGSGTLTLSGALGTESERLGTLSATAGELALSGTGYVTTLEISGDADVRVASGGKLNVTTFNASTGGHNANRNVYVEAGATVTAATLNVNWNMGSVEVAGLLDATTELYLGTYNDDNITGLLSGTGEIKATKFRASNYGSYGVNVAKLTIGAVGLVVENGSVLNLASATTTVAGTTTVNSGNELNFIAGSATLSGSVTNNGSIKVNGGSLTLENGISGDGTVALTGGSLALGSGENITNTIAQFNYSGGTLSHSGLTVTNATFSGCTLVNTGALTLNGTLNIVNQEALTKSGTVSYSHGDNGFYRGIYYVVQSAENSGASLTTGDNFVLQLAGTAISGTSGNSSNYWSKDESGNLLLTLQDNAGTYFVNTGTVTAGGAAPNDGTNQASRFTVAAGATLQLQGNPSNSLTAGQALITTTGEGNITLGTNASIAASTVSQATGKLTITSSATLTMDAGTGTKTSVYDLSSFTSVELDGGTIQYHGDATTLNNVTVTGNGAHITFRDVNNENAAMTLAGTTTLYGTLKLDTLSNDPDTDINAWKYGVDIARLTGSGTLDIHSTDYSVNTGETAKVSIQDLSGFTGNISLSKHIGPAQLNLNNLSGTPGLKTIAMGGGAQTTLSVNADTEATMATVISGNGSVTKQGAGKLTLSGASSYTGTTTVSAGELALAAGASLGSGAVTVASGASLSLGENATLTLSSGTSSLGTLTAGTGSKINLAANATLNRLSSTTRTVTLTGSGVYDLGSSKELNLTLGSGWQGAVALSSVSMGNESFEVYGNTGSTIRLTNVTGYWLMGDKEFGVNLELVNGANGYAYGQNNGGNGDNRTINGSVAGSGNWGRIDGTGTDQTWKFAGDVSNWAGKIFNNVSNADRETTYIFTGEGTGAKAMDVQVEIRNENITAAGEYSGASSSGALHLELSNNSGFNVYKDIRVSDVKIGTGAVKLAGESNSIKAGNVTISQQNASLSNVTVQGSSISATADGTKGSISDANVEIAQLAEDASFTIQDMTLTNTTITAATTETRVNLSNVSGDATLAKGTFGLQMQSGDPQVGMGGASLSYGVAGTPSLTLCATEASLVITVDPSADANGIYQDYTLTFNLNVNLDSVPVSGEDWKALVGFEGWLGTMLENQAATYQVADGAAQVAEGNSAPTVSYGYAEGGSGSNVGTLTITIAGLNVPEPTTSTLSLLALAALAARRRRND